jgi:tRNA A-37 threonylcarbamoyl transferase component Bud32
MDNLQPGQNLGAYRIIEQVGRGGMATVYKAYHAAMDRYVAIKVLPRQLAENPEFTGRFRREARTIANLEHPHILPVYDSGESDGVTYLVMRYLEAGTLKDRMDEGPLTLAQVDRYFSQLADGLGYAHRKGVIHRDLKPSNALVDAQDNLFLTDFGIAKLLEDGATKFTATGGVIGTPTYMSPEQGQGRPVDQRSDIYSLGVVLYEMVTGKVPYEAETPLAVLMQHIQDPLPLPSKVKPDVSPAVEQVILKALAKSPDDRYPSATEFLEAWKAALAGSPTLAAKPGGANRPVPETVAARHMAALTASQAAPIPAAPTPASQKRGTSAVLMIAIVGVVLCLGAVAVVALGGYLFSQLKASPAAQRTAVVEKTPVPVEMTAIPPAAQTESAGAQATPAPISDGSQATPEPAGTVVASSEMNLPAGDQFTLAIGQAVSNGKPGPGAGNIEKAGAQDIYLFAAKPGQTVYIQVTPEPKISASISWKLVDSAGAKVFETCLQCTEPGVQTLDRGGTYALIVGNDASAAPATGTYGFKLWDVPAPQPFTINVGDAVSSGKPGAGAGNIESPGAKDVYTLNAKAGQTVYFQVTQPNKDGTLQWQLLDDAGSKVFETCLQCTEPGDQALDKGGTYTLIVGNDSGAATGTYGFKLWDVPAPQPFTINVGDAVSSGKPGVGAGNIESPGVKDIYTFSAKAGQTVYFQVTQPNKGDTLRWQLQDDAGSKVFDTCLQCTEPGDQTLDKGGVYTLIVGNDSGAETGTYGFKLWDVPAPQEFNLNIGDTVSNGQPGAGAGNIESPGVKDSYTFTATAGQKLTFHITQPPKTSDTLKWQLVDDTGNKLFDSCLQCGDPAPQTLDKGGQYRLVVGNDSGAATGVYGFQIANASP